MPLRHALLLAGAGLLPTDVGAPEDAPHTPLPPKYAYGHIRAFDEERFAVRSAAYYALLRDVEAWHKDHQKPYPFKHLFERQSGESCEMQRRKDLLFERCDALELEELWKHPTMIRIPDAWRKEGPTSLAVLQEIERQTQQRVRYSYEWTRSIKESRLPPLDCERMPYWQLLQRALVKPYAPNSASYVARTQDGRRDIVHTQFPVHHLDDGPLSTTLEVRQHIAELKFHADPSLALTHTTIRSAVYRFADGSSANACPMPFCGGPLYVDWVLPTRPQGSHETADLHVEVDLHAFRTEQFTIGDPTARAVFRTRACELVYEGDKMKPQTRGDTAAWVVPFTFTMLAPRGASDIDAYFQGASWTDMTHATYCPHFSRPTKENGVIQGRIFFSSDPRGSILRLPVQSTAARRTYSYAGLPLPTHLHIPGLPPIALPPQP